MGCTLRHKMDERNSLVKDKLSPNAVRDWVISGFGLRQLAGIVKRRAKMPEPIVKLTH